MKFIKRIAFIALVQTILIAGAEGQTVDSRNSPTGKGIVFKIPDNVFPMDWNKSGFLGILMLEKDSPSGVFAAYPNNGGETIESLRERIAKFIVPMFGSEDKDKTEFTFKKHSIPNRKGDFGASGLYYLYENDKSLVQVLFYEREGDSKNMLYGYFARRLKGSKDEKKSIWADDKGEGVKILEKFAKSFN
jgi:hypothetical protein